MKYLRFLFVALALTLVTGAAGCSLDEACWWETGRDDCIYD